SQAQVFGRARALDRDLRIQAGVYKTAFSSTQLIKLIQENLCQTNKKKII
ncbi:MAG: hypothetical protein ACJA04_001136, partial [Cellvibrionaceae bacterium]